MDDTAEEVVLANSRTAQTAPLNNQHATTTSTHHVANRATSFADFELLYEINMAKKIFFKPTTIESQSDSTIE